MWSGRRRTRRGLARIPIRAAARGGGRGSDRGWRARLRGVLRELCGWRVRRRLVRLV